MTFDDITADGRLWAVRYEGETDNALFQLFDRWNDVSWLRDFFKTNISDLSSYFRITDVNKAIYDTIDDAEILQCLIMDISSDADLDRIFRPLENFRTSDELLGKEKARLKSEICRPSSSSRDGKALYKRRYNKVLHYRSRRKVRQSSLSVPASRLSILLLRL